MSIQLSLAHFASTNIWKEETKTNKQIDYIIGLISGRLVRARVDRRSQ